MKKITIIQAFTLLGKIAFAQDAGNNYEKSDSLEFSSVRLSRSEINK